MKSLAAAWAVTLAAMTLLAVLVAGRAEIVTDLSFFLPEGRDVESRALAAGYDRPGTLLMVRLSGGADERDMARISDRVTADLRAESAVALVRNGRPHIDAALQKFILDNRYLLGPSIASDHFSAPALESAIAGELAGLAGTSGWVMRDLFPRDPVGRYRAVIASGALSDGPTRRHGVWMDDDDRALLLIYLTAASGDVAAQAQAMADFNRVIEAARADWPDIAAEVSGPGIFALRASEKIRGDMTRLTAIAVGAVAFLLLALYRSIALLLLAGVPVTLGLMTGMLATQGIFGSVHGVAITFGAVLAGVAVDYPIHLFGHRRVGEKAAEAARRIARPMAVGAATTFVGLLALTQSSFPGLAQIGVMSATGVATALIVSRWWLPRLMSGAGPVGAGRRVAAFWTVLRNSPRGRRAVAALGLLAFVALALSAALRPSPVWETDLTRISLADTDEKVLDQELRAALRLPDVRRALIVEGADAQDVLTKWPEVLDRLDAAVSAGRLGGYPPLTGLLPSRADQESRQDAMPDAAVLQEALERAVVSLPLDVAVLAPYVADVRRQKQAEPILPEDLAAGPLGILYPAPWLMDDGAAAMIPLVPPIDLTSEDLPSGDGAARLVDLAQIAQEIVGGYRREALTLLLIGLALGGAVLAWGARRRIWRVALPPVAAVALTAAFLLTTGIALNLFHLLALLLVASIGVDYALFFPDYSKSDQDGTLGFRSVTACCATTTVVFAVLATSSIPVLGAIGTTVAIGAVLSFVLTLCLAGGARSQ